MSNTIIQELKAELYDKEKIIKNLSHTIDALAAVTATNSLQELYDRVVFLVQKEKEEEKEEV